MKIKIFTTAFAMLLLSISSIANAGLIEQGDSYTYYGDGNGLEWVYASPCAGQNGCGNDVNLIDGFRFASDIDWSASFADLASLISAFELNNYAPSVCASSYFGSGHNHCDSGDVILGYVWGAPLGIAASANHASHSAAETFLVRGQVDGRIPEPSTLAIFSLGLLGLASRKLKNN